MNDDTRKLLKVFGVAVTDSEAEADKLAGVAAQLSAATSKEDLAKLLKDSADLCRELNTRWLEITQRVFAIQSQLQNQLTEAASRWQTGARDAHGGQEFAPAQENLFGCNRPFGQMPAGAEKQICHGLKMPQRSGVATKILPSR